VWTRCPLGRVLAVRVGDGMRGTPKGKISKR
jgi:hypothetical protein